MNDAYTEGYEAGSKLCTAGVAANNPYAEGSRDYDEWRAGYNDSCDDYAGVLSV